MDLGATKTSKELFEIYEVVWSLENYAKKIYKGGWEDALDAAMFHIIRNYDVNKGDLSNYAIKVVKGICYNKYRKEVPYEYLSDLPDSEMETTEVVDDMNMEDDNGDKQDIAECIAFLSPYFIEDFKFFTSMCKHDRKKSYPGLFERFTYQTIKDAISYLKDNYSEQVKEFHAARISRSKKRYDADKVNRSMADGINYMGVVNGTVLYTKRKSIASKVFYRVDIPEVVQEFIKRFYGDDSNAQVRIGDCVAFSSLTGSIIFGIENLLESLEIDIIGMILSRQEMKVASYTKGEELILVSNRQEEYNLNVKAFSSDIWIPFTQMSSKEVKAC